MFDLNDGYGFVHRTMLLYFFYDGTGIAMTHTYGKNKMLRYFKFASCEHNYSELSMKECQSRGIYYSGNCYHVYECTKCNWIEAVDSSD